MVLYAPISKSTFVSLFKVSLNKNKYEKSQFLDSNCGVGECFFIL